MYKFIPLRECESKDLSLDMCVHSIAFLSNTKFMHQFSHGSIRQVVKPRASFILGSKRTVIDLCDFIYSKIVEEKKCLVIFY